MNLFIKKISWLLIAIIIVSGCNSTTNKSNDNNDPPATGVAGDGRLDQIVEYIADRYYLPAIAAVVIHGDTVIESSAVGLRSIESSQPVTQLDKWHIGSITKSMTSTLTARLIQQGFLSWETTLAEVFPELIGIMRPEYEDIQVGELLTHCAGFDIIMPDLPNWENYFADNQDLVIQREEIVTDGLQIESSGTRGNYSYNNFGYVVAGAILERITDMSWESLMQYYVFKPLEMNDSGFGAPDTEGTMAQPVGHAFEDNTWMPIDPSFEEISDNPAAIGPAGTVHTTLADISHYAIVHLKGLRHEHSDFLNNELFEKLHGAGSANNNAMGWVVMENGISHDGSNNLWLAFLAINATENSAIFIVTNAADLERGDDSDSLQALDELHTELIARSRAALSIP